MVLLRHNLEHNPISNAAEPPEATRFFEDAYSKSQQQQQPEITPQVLARALSNCNAFDARTPEFQVVHIGCLQNFRGENLAACGRSLDRWVQNVNEQLRQQNPPMRLSLEPLSPELQRTVEQTCRREGIAVPQYLRMLRIYRNNTAVGEGGILGLNPPPQQQQRMDA